MANNNGNRVCPKCGTFLGQKNVCPICGRPEQKHENGNGAESVQDYVSRVIDFVEKHPDDWDDEFNTFFDRLAGKQDFDECYEACSKTSEILKTEMPDSGKISGSLTRKAMADLRSVFPELENEAARALALNMLKKRMEPEEAGEGGGIVVPNRKRLERYRQLKDELTGEDVRNDFKAVMKRMKKLLKEYPDYFELDYENFYDEIVLGTPERVDEDGVDSSDIDHRGLCPLAFFAAMMIPRWNQFIQEYQPIGCGPDSYHGLFDVSMDAPFGYYYYVFYIGDRNTGSSIGMQGWRKIHPCEGIVHVEDKNDRFDGEWQELVPKGKTVLILGDAENIILRPASKPGETSCGAGDIVDGLQYRCTCASHYYSQAQFAYIVSPE